MAGLFDALRLLVVFTKDVPNITLIPAFSPQGKRGL